MLKIKRYLKYNIKLAVVVLLAGIFADCVLAAEMETSLTQYGMLPIYGNEIRDGVYSVSVKTSDAALVFGNAKLTIADGEMNAELTVGNQDITQLFVGVYDDGGPENVSDSIEPIGDENGNPVYRVSVGALNQELDCSVYDANLEEWNQYEILFEAGSLPEDALLVELPDYDLIENAINSYENSGNRGETAEEKHTIFAPVTPVSIALEDGEYSVSVDVVGGSGKAYITTPTMLVVKDGKAYAQVEWSSSNYDYMIVGTEKYLNTSEEGVNSVFEIPIACWDEDMTVIADTTAMGTPHEVEYALTFYKDSIGGKGELPREAAKRVVLFAIIIIVGGGILNYVLKKRRNGV